MCHKRGMDLHRLRNPNPAWEPPPSQVHTDISRPLKTSFTHVEPRRFSTPSASSAGPPVPKPHPPPVIPPASLVSWSLWARPPHPPAAADPWLGWAKQSSAGILSQADELCSMAPWLFLPSAPGFVFPASITFPLLTNTKAKENSWEQTSQ